MEKDYKTAIGMMSGTSLDGIDACLIKIYKDFNFEILDCNYVQYSEEDKTNLLNIANNKGSTKDICKYDFEVAKYFAKCANDLVKKSNIKPDFIASHGQTVFHIPSQSTLQIGNISVIAELTGITTIGDFRTRDIAAGGHGAPLVPFVDEIIFKKDKNRAIQNIGGIGNVTVLSKNCETFAFDTGPGNMLIDYYMQKFFNLPYDKDGATAKSGQIDEHWLAELLNENYYKLQPPKTTGRELYNSVYAEEILTNAPEKPQDIIATITALTAKTIEMAYKNFVFDKTTVDEIVLGGGGAYNQFLKQLLQKNFKNIPIKTHSDFGINDKLKEAASFAILGYCTLQNIPNNLPNCTGAKKKVVMGSIAY